ncbi:dihydrofolate reductase [Cohnella fermenti]|uniref:Dihydrofolate reductase n=1 Tax=Cohnella fermenti TaxID=2565925 RepID=A0A4S4BIU1_9BACL|nr:dihydrofolate reductase [Cohnella fermenti]THF74562.1 dihydrofolate reductase [Cohnella fermenti]
MTITLIAAVARNGVIGADNALLWRLPADMKFFKSRTVGKPVLMGRKTFESLGRPLKDRTNIVLSRTLAEAPEGCILVRTAEEAIDVYAKEELMVIGGAELYRQLLGKADRLVLTEIDESFEGDAFFPAFDRAEWNLVSSTDGVLDEKNRHPHVFCIYERKRV